jgi:hypothetical protein
MSRRKVLAILQPALLLRSRDHVYRRIAVACITPAAKTTTCPLYYNPYITTLQDRILKDFVQDTRAL